MPQQRRVLHERDVGIHAHVVRTGRQHQSRVEEMRRPGLAGRLLLGEDDPDLRAVERRLAERGVVDLQFDDAAGLEPERRAFGHHLRIRARRVGADQPLPLVRGHRRARRRRSQDGRRFLHLFGVAPDDGRRRPIGLRAVEHQHVVDGRAHARPHLDRLHPLGFREIGRNVEVLVRDFARRRHGIGLLHFEDLVRLAELPAVGKQGRGGMSAGFPFGAPPLAHRSIVSFSAADRRRSFRNVPSGAFGVPRRHVSLADLIADLRPVGFGVLVRQQWHRPDFAGAMAGDAVLEQDRRDVFGERRHGRRRRRRLRGLSGRHDRPRENHNPSAHRGQRFECHRETILQRVRSSNVDVRTFHSRLS